MLGIATAEVENPNSKENKTVESFGDLATPSLVQLLQEVGELMEVWEIIHMDEGASLKKGSGVWPIWCRTMLRLACMILVEARLIHKTAICGYSLQSCGVRMGILSRIAQVCLQ